MVCLTEMFLIVSKSDCVENVLVSQMKHLIRASRVWETEHFGIISVLRV